MKVVIKTFGHKYREQPESDFYVDAQDMANPVHPMMAQVGNGVHPEVRNQILGLTGAQVLLDKLSPARGVVYNRKGLNFVNTLISIGDGGGRLRSVALAELFADQLRLWDNSLEVLVDHMEEDQWPSLNQQHPPQQH